MDLEYRQFKVLILSLLAVLLMAFVGFVYFLAKESIESSGRVSVQVGNATVAAEVVASPYLRANGLSGRSYLGELEGMLFIFDRPSQETFWMKGMLIPIDIIWIRSGTVVGVTENLKPPAENTPDLALPFYPSPVPVDQVLEVSAGFVKNYRIQTGDRVVVNFRQGGIAAWRMMK